MDTVAMVDPSPGPVGPIHPLPTPYIMSITPVEMLKHVYYQTGQVRAVALSAPRDGEVAAGGAAAGVVVQLVSTDPRYSGYTSLAESGAVRLVADLNEVGGRPHLDKSILP
eukprot:147938-Prorocentrum_minimum.AAC.2